MVTAMARVIRQVPRGRVSTYGAVAKAAGYPRCARHVSRVLRLVEGLPWQRILGSGGRISLRREGAMEQRLRLQFEGITFSGSRVSLREYEHQFRTSEASGKPAKNRKRRLGE